MTNINRSKYTISYLLTILILSACGPNNETKNNQAPKIIEKTLNENSNNPILANIEKNKIIDIIKQWDAEAKMINGGTIETLNTRVGNLRLIANQLKNIRVNQCAERSKERITTAMDITLLGVMMYLNNTTELDDSLLNMMNTQTQLKEEDKTDYEMRLLVAKELNNIKREPPIAFAKLFMMYANRMMSYGIETIEQNCNTGSRNSN